MDLQQKREAFLEATKQLAGDDRFRTFCEGLRELMDESLHYACSDASFDTPQKQAAAMGEVRAYRDILATVDDARDASIAKV
jgi:hypothetical protein